MGTPESGARSVSHNVKEHVRPELWTKMLWGAQPGYTRNSACCLAGEIRGWPLFHQLNDAALGDRGIEEPQAVEKEQAAIGKVVVVAEYTAATWELLPEQE